MSFGLTMPFERNPKSVSFLIMYMQRSWQLSKSCYIFLDARFIWIYVVHFAAGPKIMTGINKISLRSVSSLIVCFYWWYSRYSLYYLLEIHLTGLCWSWFFGHIDPYWHINLKKDKYVRIPRYVFTKGSILKDREM